MDSALTTETWPTQAYPSREEVHGYVKRDCKRYLTATILTGVVIIPLLFVNALAAAVAAFWAGWFARAAKREIDMLNVYKVFPEVFGP